MSSKAGIIVDTDDEYGPNILSVFELEDARNISHRIAIHLYKSHKVYYINSDTSDIKIRKIRNSHTYEIIDSDGDIKIFCSEEICHKLFTVLRNNGIRYKIVTCGPVQTSKN